MLYRYSFLIVLWLAGFSSAAQAPQSLNDTIPLHSNVRHGVLPNGLSWYLFKNQTDNKIAINLVVKAGKANQQDNESSAAHVVEHLSFRSTKNFPEGVIPGLEKRGLVWGTDFTASTRTLATYYRIIIPNADPGLLKTALLACKDFAGGRLYRPEEVEQERAAVLNEYRMAGPDGNYLAEQAYQLLNKPPYDKNLTDEIRGCENISIKTLQRFDSTWYRPELQAIIVVGNFNVPDIEKEIATLFSTPSGSALQSRPSGNAIVNVYDALLTESNRLIIMVPEFSNRSRIRINFFQKKKSVMTHGVSSTFSQQRIKLVDKMYNMLVANRLKMVSNAPEQLVHRVERGAINPLANVDALTTTLSVNKTSEIKQRIVAVWTELNRIKTWGFTEKEFHLVKELTRKDIEADAQAMSSQTLAGRLANHFLDHTIFPENEAGLNTTLLNTISLSEIHEMAHEWISQTVNTDVVLAVNDKTDQNLPGENQLFQWMNTTLAQRIKPYAEIKVKSLPDPPIILNRKFTRTKIDTFDAVQLQLDNGARVVIKRIGPAAPRKRIFLEGFNKGGTSSYKDADAASAKVSSALVSASGIANLTAPELDTWLKERNTDGHLYVSPFINESEHGVSGSAIPDNMESLLHLTILYFTHPRKDKAVFHQKFGSINTLNKYDPRQLFNDSIVSVFTGTRHRSGSAPPDFKKAFSIYRETFSNASDFTFVISGYFETEDMVKLAVRYLGALPAKKRSRVERRTSSQPASLQIDKNLRVTLVDDNAGNADVQLMFTGSLPFSVRNQLLMELAGKILNPILTDRLRIQEKAVYSLNAGGSLPRNGPPASLGVRFETLPQNIDRLSAATREEFHKIAAGNLDDTVFETTWKEMQLKVSNEPRSALYINNYLTDELRAGTRSPEGLDRESILKTITKQDMITLFRDFIDTDNCIIFELL